MRIDDKILKNKCCGCGLCESSCPQFAIEMKQGMLGCIEPVIDENKCVDCGLCYRICPLSDDSNLKNSIIASYAAASRTDDIFKSTSGGAFYELAKNFIEEGGVVCGCTMFFENGKAIVKHIVVDSLCNLYMLQGSKYVQSEEICYQEIKEYLDKKVKVLFSGTPCQVAAVKRRYSQYSSLLYTVDIICHGVPSVKLFNDYLQLNYQNKVRQVFFRHKDKGWGHTCIKIILDDGTIDYVDAYKSSYYRYFLHSEIYRKGCYECRYSNLYREGDITLGDCWGIESFSPDLLIDNDGVFDKKRGISCVLVNSRNGEEWLKKCSSDLNVEPIDIADLLIINKQLIEPAAYSCRRKKIISTYNKNGYKGIEKINLRELRVKKIKRKIKNVLKICITMK